MNKKRILIPVFFIILMIASTYAIVSYVCHIGARYSIVHVIGLEAKDQDGNTLTRIDWGNITLPETKEVLGTLRNTGNTKGLLTYTATPLPSNCSFSIKYLDAQMVWQDLQNYIIDVNEQISVKYVYTANYGAPVGEFSLDITITNSEV